MSSTFAQRLAARIRSWRRAPLQEDISATAARALADAVGCALAATAAPAVVALRGVVLDEGGRQQAALWGSGKRVSAAQAALVNGTAAHALDFDDVSRSMLSHPSAVLAPAVLGLAEAGKVSGESALRAYLAGYSAGCSVAARLNPAHYAAGWHATATLGALCAAAAAACLLDLDESEIVDALGFAASSAAGLQANFGSDAKAVHAGAAARAGVSAALMALAGLTARPDCFEAEGGFFSLYGGASEAAEGAATLLSDLDFKRYPCCAQAHSTISALLALPRPAAPGDIVRIDCHVNALARQVCRYDAAAGASQARFCIPYSAAVTVIDGGCGLAQFEPGRVEAADVQMLTARVHVHVDMTFSRDTISPARVDILLKDGTVLASEAEGSRRATPAELEAKFIDCATRVLPQRQAADLYRGLLAIRDARDVGGIVRLTCAS